MGGGSVYEHILYTSVALPRTGRFGVGDHTFKLATPSSADSVAFKLCTVYIFQSVLPLLLVSSYPLLPH